MVHSSVYKKLLCGVEHPKKGRCVRGKQVQSLRGRENESERVESSPVTVMFNITSVGSILEGGNCMELGWLLSSVICPL